MTAPTATVAMPFDNQAVALAEIAATMKDRKGDPETDGTADSAGRVGLRSGNVSELTGFMKLRPGGADYLRKIFAMLNGTFDGAQVVGTLHDMRFIFIDNDTRMLFATAYDGDWESYINDFATKIPELMDLIFSATEGWPGIHSNGVKDFISSAQVTADGWFVANPRVSVADVRRLRKTEKALNEFLDKIS